MFSSTPFRFLALLVPVLILAVLPLVAEEDEANPRHQYEDKKFIHESDPMFFIKLPKKMRDEWRFVDLFDRRDAAEAIIKAEMEKTDDDAKRSQLEGSLQRLSQTFGRIKMILESTRARAFNKLDSDGNGLLSTLEWKGPIEKFHALDTDQSKNLSPAEFAADVVAPNMTRNGIPGVVPHITVEVGPATTTHKISEIKPTKGYSENWNISKTVIDKDTTSKREAKKQRYSHIYEIEASHKKDPKAAKFWIRVQTFLVYNKKKTDRYVVTITHMVPQAEASDEVKKESAKLFSAIKIL